MYLVNTNLVVKIYPYSGSLSSRRIRAADCSSMSLCHFFLSIDFSSPSWLPCPKSKLNAESGLGEMS